MTPEGPQDGRLTLILQLCCGSKERAVGGQSVLGCDPSCWGTSKYQKVVNSAILTSASLQSSIWKQGQRLNNPTQLGLKLATKSPHVAFPLFQPAMTP